MWRRRALVAGWVIVLGGWGIVAIALLLRIPAQGSDFGIFLGAGEALRINLHANIYNGGVIYVTHKIYGGCPLWGGPTGPGYVYPPLLALILAPVSALPCAGATYLWHTVNTALWVLCTVILARRAYASSPWLALAVVALSATYPPLLQGL